MKKSVFLLCSLIFMPNLEKPNQAQPDERNRPAASEVNNNNQINK